MNLDGLNDMQKRAVKHTEGPLLIIAGAGSGKTRVLTHRIAYLIEECGVSPYNILAITFTNKAAKEMKERVEKIVDCGSHVWVSTFHSTCVRILRRFIDRIGYDTNFTIYDTDDQKSVVKEACKKLNIDTKMMKERAILSAISSAKNEMVTPDEMEINAGGDYYNKRVASVYREYQKTLKANNALDFDDLLFKTVELFEHDDEVLNSYQEKFKYIMVDEYQDTNNVQFKLISLLASKYGNLCVVGDDDQSIYKFRGANIGNILSFESTFADTKVIKLEQNYRSTKTILEAANAVVKNNIGRKDKELWTDNPQGDKVNFTLYEDGYKEAAGIAEGISSKVRDGWNYNDFAILYRTNAQSRLLEEGLIAKNIPYRLYGGVNFYQRREIKDILAYLKTIDNGLDSQAVKRIINVPKRGIGATTIERIQIFADLNDFTFWDALVNADQIPDIGRGLSKLEAFVTLIEGFKAKMQFMSIKDLTETIIRDIGYYEYLAETDTPDEVADRQSNIGEFINKIVSYEEGEGEDNYSDSDPELLAHLGGAKEEKSLGGFLSEVALVADIDNLDQSGNQVVLMTLHSAKGLEFPIVYMAGLEDGLFPSYMTIVSDDETEVEEERRLCYVGITRAEKELYISSAKQRMIRGEMQINKVSRFVKEIPQKLLEVTNQATGYNKSKIAFGGGENTEREGRFDVRASARAAINRYGTGNATYKEPSRIRIEGKTSNSTKYAGSLAGYAGSSADRTGSSADHMGSTYSNLRHINTAYATNYGSSASGTPKRTSTGYGNMVKNVSDAEPNKKVGFGKEFPMDIFDVKKTVKTAKTVRNIKSGGDDEGNNFDGVSGKTSGGVSGKASSGMSRSVSGNTFVGMAGGVSGKASSGMASGTFGNISDSGLGYEVGDTVSHVKFGVGKVKSIENATKDYMVTVDFQDFGIKKMLAGFAKLKKE